MTMASLPAPPTSPFPHLFTGPGLRTWDLDRDFLDHHLDGWRWDGEPYTNVAGPVLASMTSERREYLVALACCSGLLQVPLDAGQDLAHVLDPRDTAWQACAGGAA